MSARNLIILVSAILMCGATIAPSWANDVAQGFASQLDDIQMKINIGWVLFAAMLVLLMQTGFLLMEAGMVRSKNAVNVAQKNIIDLAISTLIFGSFGFMFAFGTSSVLPIGIDKDYFLLLGLDDWGVAVFIFQAMFCGAAATIVAGAVAERMRMMAYVLATVFVASIVYPVFVHWAWGNALKTGEGAFLANLGFMDFAGSTVVHATGAWMALAACIVIGARKGKFDAQGRPVRFFGHSPILATAGSLFLLVGWLGFNGGSTLSLNGDVAHIIANTLCAGSAGTMGVFLLLRITGKKFYPEILFSGMLGGLVATTAGALALTGLGAVFLGFVGGITAVYANWVLEEKFKIDDAVGAIGIHGVAGVVGTLGVALIAPVSTLPLGNRLDQFLVQLFGSAINFLWVFGLGWVFFSILKRFVALRVDAAGEQAGLNKVEHNTLIGIGHVEDALSSFANKNVDLGMRLPVVPGDDAEQVSQLFNQLIEAIEIEEHERQFAHENQRDGEEAERLKALANATSEAILITSGDKIFDGNAALEGLLGQRIDDLQSRKITDFIAPQALKEFELRFSTHSTEPFEIEFSLEDGTTIPVEMRTKKISYRGQRARVSAIVDLTARKASERRIRHLAQHDPLTDLPNRAVFTRALVKMLEENEQTGRGAAILLIDLDKFKEINDVHGHPAGDLVIKSVADILRSVVRSGDTVARMGGDEFAIIQKDLSKLSDAVELGNRIIARLTKPIEDKENCTMLHIGGSVGIAYYPHHGMDAKLLVSRADTALYKAKAHGRGKVCVFEEGMDADMRKRRALEGDLANALQRGEFELYLQPRMNAHVAAIDCYEALVRWNHPEKGMVSPADFIPVAEQSGKIVPLGTWVLREACRIGASYLDGKKVSINVSPLQFREKNFLNVVHQALADSGISPQAVELEITESVVIDDDERALDILNELKDMGVRIALDDFGIGYSSLGYISRFPFDAIKIDRGFVNEMQDSKSALAVVEAVLGMGRSLDITIVAEGIERLEQLETLVEMGCDEIQGFLVGKPEPLHQLCATPPLEVRRLIERARETDLQADDAHSGLLRQTAAQMREMARKKPSAANRAPDKKKNQR